MTDQTDNKGDFFYGVMILKEGKWTPHSKYDQDSLGSALASAASLSDNREYEGAKVMRVPLKGPSGKMTVEPKEMWISPHLKARMEARTEAQILEGARKSKEQLAKAHAEHMASLQKRQGA